MERLENIKELATLALKYDNLEASLGVEKLLEDASLASDQDSLIERGEKKEIINQVLFTNKQIISELKKMKKKFLVEKMRR